LSNMTVRPKQFLSSSVKIRRPATTGLPHRERAMTEDDPSIATARSNGLRLKVMRGHLRQRRSAFADRFFGGWTETWNSPAARFFSLTSHFIPRCAAHEGQFQSTILNPLGYYAILILLPFSCVGARSHAG
jgi:hypothetical protein